MECYLENTKVTHPFPWIVFLLYNALFSESKVKWPVLSLSSLKTNQPPCDKRFEHHIERRTCFINGAKLRQGWNRGDLLSILDEKKPVEWDDIFIWEDQGKKGPTRIIKYNSNKKELSVWKFVSILLNGGGRVYSYLKKSLNATKQTLHEHV